MSEPLTAEQCLDFDPNEPSACSGPVEFRHALSPSGRSFPRCDSHWSQRLDWQTDHNSKYPDSDVAPSWFDPLAAGESWDES